MTGFPRPRGDGPIWAAGWDGSCWFSPPTRGWPGRVLRCRRHHLVFPAHAGMARRNQKPNLTPGSFPRPRGDGPSDPPPQPAQSAFSPPTRGWPLGSAGIWGPGVVFPAHAGMARIDDTRRRGRWRFPRPRGDGPDASTLRTVARLFSPPTRGWPVGCGNHPPASRVFPAHAGMAR